MCALLRRANKEITCALRPYIEGRSAFSDKGWSSDFPPLPDAFSGKYPMALLSGSHNGVHCCGTVGDSHSHSQLSTAKCTFAGDSFQNRAAKVRIIFEYPYNLAGKSFIVFFDSAFRNNQ